MGTIDMNKVNLIMTMTDEHLKKHDEYRFACNLTESEKVFLEKRYNIEEAGDFSVSKLYKLTKK